MAGEDLKAKLLERIQNRFSERVLGAPKRRFDPIGSGKAAASATASVVKKGVDFIKSGVRAVPRAVASVAISASNALTQGRSRTEFTPESKLDKFIFGDEIVRDIPGTGEDFMKSVGVNDEASRKLALPVGAALTVADLVPGGKKKVGETIAKKFGTSKAVEQMGVNTSKLVVSQAGKEKLDSVTAAAASALQKVKGKTLTNEEVIEAAKTSKILTKGTSREATLKSEAALLRTRQNLAALAEGKGVSSDFIKQLRVIKAEAARRGRELQALSIDATPELDSVKSRMVKQLLDLDIEADEIMKAAKGVDFNNAKQATAFYRKFVKPKFSELVDEFRYINLLSSPRTHIVNAFSNLIQATALNPATKLVSGAIDAVASKLTGKTRQAYMSEVPAYFRGVVNSVGDATRGFVKAIRGEKFIERPDLFEVPTGSKLLSPLQFVPRLLDASDVFFRTLVHGGERESLALRYARQGKELAWPLIDEASAEKANYWLFRKALDPSNSTGQGTLLSKIDGITSAAYSLRKVPGVKWFIPFIQTPMNILKQGIEFSPLGLSTLPGSTQKIEQLSKALIGSTVFTGAGYLALQGDVTWAVPKNEKEREAFYASGRQPYAVKVGDKWVGFSRLGPLAYPMAMAAAIQWHVNENPDNFTDSDMAKASDVLFGLAEFFSDQSYMHGLNDFLDVVQGDKTAVTRIATNAPSQLIPLSSLQRWVAQLIDPVYRKKDNDLSVEAIIDNLKAGLPFVSKDLEPYTNPFGFPSKRQFPGANSVSPLQVTEEQPLFEGQLQSIRFQRRADKLEDQQDEIRERLKSQLRQRLFAN